MRQTREQKQQEKLQSLAMILGLVDRFGKGKRTEDQLRQEQVLSAQQGRQQQQALLPLLLEQQQLANRGASSDLDYAGERRPLELEQQRAILSNMGLEQDFNRQTLSDRVGLVGAQAEAARRANDFDKQTFNDRLQVSGQAPALGAMQLKQGGQQIESQRLQDLLNRQRMQQDEELFPLKQQEAQAEIDYRQAMINPMGALGSGQQAAPQTNIDPSVLELDKMFGAGMRYPTQTLEQSNVYRQMLPKLIDSINKNPGAQWSPQSQAIKQYMDNAGGVPYDPALGITEEELNQILGVVQPRPKPTAAALAQKTPPNFVNWITNR